MRFISVFSISMMVLASAHSKVLLRQGRFFVETKGERKPIMMVNTLADQGAISQVKLYGDGKVNLISFKKEGENKEKLYSVAENGFIYSIKPFTDYEVQSVKDGLVQFKQNQRRYKIDSKGFFIY